MNRYEKYGLYPTRTPGVYCSEKMPLRNYLLDPLDSSSFENILDLSGINNHLILMAKSGAGKSEVLKDIFINLCIKGDCSVLLMDPHGDLAEQCARLIKDGDKRIVYIDPTLKEGFTPTLNPFEIKEMDEQTISTVAQEIISALESIIGAEYSVNMEAMITPLVYTLVRKGNSDISELLRFFDKDNNHDLIMLGLKSPIKQHAEFFKSVFNTKTYNVSKNAIIPKLQVLLNYPVFANFVLGKNTINLEKALNSNKIIIVRLQDKKLKKVLEPIAKFIMAQVQSIISKRSDMAPELRPKTFLICDEFQKVFSEISDQILSESRKNNLFLIAAHQHLHQIGKSKYDVLSNVRHIIVGKNSLSDMTEMAKEMDIDVKYLKELNYGEFCLKSGTDDCIKFKVVDTFLGNKESISEKHWKKRLKKQRKKYYRKISKCSSVDVEVEIIDEFEDEFEDE